ncbi:hypothetical protein HanRHA438_Chr12g0573481 [Helianthus annuus]|uniref:Uncharacterized protein n=1 Tax=Helianthus annuus TaxID=4232 RepID=A0A251T6G4_HELAN|nr:hypothetical protein HanXRQr2_Chr12g0562261 [Helianthus annuus]KAJ0864414.1 hypothetical protein HanPSC8_Chr12g0541731 [Helianthus annuus]KAJ0868336.1 hypothetical protein HanRHA438_Chr12g0573481 [Helianthus annuus]
MPPFRLDLVHFRLISGHEMAVGVLLQLNTVTPCLKTLAGEAYDGDGGRWKTKKIRTQYISITSRCVSKSP